MAIQHPQGDQHRGSKDAKPDKGIKASPDKSGTPVKQAPASGRKHTDTSKKPSSH